jgi:hypothetical protein
MTPWTYSCVARASAIHDTARFQAWNASFNLSLIILISYGLCTCLPGYQCPNCLDVHFKQTTTPALPSKPRKHILPDIRAFGHDQTPRNGHRTFCTLQATLRSMVRHVRFPNAFDAPRHLASPPNLKRPTTQRPHLSNKSIVRTRPLAT